MITKRSIQCIFLTLSLTACSSMRERNIPLADVPPAAMAAAEAAVVGFRVSSATVDSERGEVVYELEGRANDVEYEVEVTADGRVLETEQDD